MELVSGVRVAFTDRRGGFSVGPYDGRNLGGNVGDDPEAVARNREKTAAELGVARLVFMRQIHSALIERVGEGGPSQELDAIFTDRPGVAMGALGADCPAVLVAGEGWVGAAHSGRAGTLLGVVPELVKAMAGAGAGRMSAIIGPSACGRCYEVPEQMRDEAPPPMRSTTAWGTPALDLRAAIAAQLNELEVAVHHDARCTIETPDLYSYRRDGITGRFAGLIWIDPGMDG